MITNQDSSGTIVESVEPTFVPIAFGIEVGVGIVVGVGVGEGVGFGEVVSDKSETAEFFSTIKVIGIDESVKEMLPVLWIFAVITIE